jgi:hypothetical protein
VESGAELPRIPPHRPRNAATVSFSFFGDPLWSARCMALPSMPGPLWLAAALAAAGCAGAPDLTRAVTVAQGVPTTLQLVTVCANARKVFTLRNESSVARGEQAGSPASLGPLTKLIADDLLQELFDWYAELGLFAVAAPELPPDANSALVVCAGAQRFALHAVNAPDEQRQAFAEACALYLNVWNHISGYQAADRRDSKTDGSLERRRELEQLLRHKTGGRNR